MIDPDPERIERLSDKAYRIYYEDLDPEEVRADSPDLALSKAKVQKYIKHAAESIRIVR